ncbi:RNA polymerase II transcription elongation factor [Striga asiatica]|uniref:RNA polymerase II transcription elongation factor n=1 Tax=Striga asiatica TaxID=4170 RepID=A0A5A7Q1Z7_STRAF|nr:RNA polymerase II transcription elongation factor [Striga asiatica]
MMEIRQTDGAVATAAGEIGSRRGKASDGGTGGGSCDGGVGCCSVSMLVLDIPSSLCLLSVLLLNFIAIGSEPLSLEFMVAEIIIKLNSIQQSGNETKVIDIDNEHIQHNAEDCSRSRVGKIIGQKKAHLLGLHRAVTQMWHIRGQVSDRELSCNFFHFIFTDEADKQKNSESSILDIWVQAWHVPLN